MKARIKSNGKIVEVISRFMPRKRNAASRDWVCNLSDGTCIDESQLEYIEESIDGLDEAAKEYIKGYGYANVSSIYYAFIAGAKWQAKQFLKGSPMPEDTVLFNKGVEEGRRLERDEFENNRLAACNNQTKEEYNRETDFALEIIKKEHRQPTFSDAINYGMQLQKGQMMNNAIECLVCAGMEGDKWIMTYIGSYESMLETCKVGDKVRIIVCKNED